MCLIALLASIVCVVSAKAQCGHYDPSYSLSHGETVMRTLFYGTVGLGNGEPLDNSAAPMAIAGCKPPNVTYLNKKEGVRIEGHFAYAEDSPASLPLISFATMHWRSQNQHGTLHEVYSYNITYEAQLPGLALPIRPRTFRASYYVGVVPPQQPTFCIQDFSYDSQGRLVRIDFSGAQDFSHDVCVMSSYFGPASYFGPGGPYSRGNFSNVLRRSSGTAASAGYQKISYEDGTQPLHATYYETNYYYAPVFDFVAVRVQWTTRKDGLVTDELLQHVENGSCPEPCLQGLEVCCQKVGDDSSGACYSGASCADISELVLYKYDATGHLSSMTGPREQGAGYLKLPENLTLNFGYDGRGRIMNETSDGQDMGDYTYKDGHVQRFRSHVGVWDFGMPKGSDTQYV